MLWTRRRALHACGSLGVALTIPWAQQTESDLSADVRIYEMTNVHNAYPDQCGARLQRLYIAEGLQLAIAVQFNRPLSDAEARQIRWSISDGAARPSSGDFVGQPNPAQITTIATAGSDSRPTEGMVRITYHDMDIVAPLPVRVISDAEFTSAFQVLSAFTERSSEDAGRLALTTDLLARFLGQDSAAAGHPEVSTSPLNICDPRLSQRAGANWGIETVTDVPLVQYAADQPAADTVAQGVAHALLTLHAAEIGQYFASNPQEATYSTAYTYTGNLTLDVPLDANLALHGVQFDGTLSADIDAPSASDDSLTARNVVVKGSVGDLYDFNIEATGLGAMPAIEAAKVQIASPKHHIGKVFVVAVSVDTSIDSVVFGVSSA